MDSRQETPTYVLYNERMLCWRVVISRLMDSKQESTGCLPIETKCFRCAQEKWVEAGVYRADTSEQQTNVVMLDVEELCLVSALDGGKRVGQPWRQFSEDSF
jgi:hypothetical protein